jgi:hypothetical protein
MCDCKDRQKKSSMKKTLLIGVAALFLATGTAQAENPNGPFTGRAICELSNNALPECGDGKRAATEDCAENEQRVTCDNPTGWIAQCSNGDKAACKAINDLLAQVDEDERRPFEERWKPAKWECALEWGILNEEGYYSYPEAYIEREDVPKIIKAFKEMKGHCAFLQCLNDRAAGKVKHCYANDRRWR